MQTFTNQVRAKITEALRQGNGFRQIATVPGFGDMYLTISRHKITLSAEHAPTTYGNYLFRQDEFGTKINIDYKECRLQPRIVINELMAQLGIGWYLTGVLWNVKLTIVGCGTIPYRPGGLITTAPLR